MQPPGYKAAPNYPPRKGPPGGALWRGFGDRLTELLVDGWHQSPDLWVRLLPCDSSLQPLNQPPSTSSWQHESGQTVPNCAMSKFLAHRIRKYHKMLVFDHKIWGGLWCRDSTGIPALLGVASPNILSLPPWCGSHLPCWTSPRTFPRISRPYSDGEMGSGGSRTCLGYCRPQWLAALQGSSD